LTRRLPGRGGFNLFYLRAHRARGRAFCGHRHSFPHSIPRRTAFRRRLYTLVAVLPLPRTLAAPFDLYAAFDLLRCLRLRSAAVRTRALRFARGCAGSAGLRPTRVGDSSTPVPPTPLFVYVCRRRRCPSYSCHPIPVSLFSPLNVAYHSFWFGSVWFVSLLSLRSVHYCLFVLVLPFIRHFVRGCDAVVSARTFTRPRHLPAGTFSV